MNSRTGLLCACIAISAGASTVSVAQTADSAPPMVLKADHLFDSVSGKISAPGIVLISNHKIQAVGSDVKIPANAKVIDLGDATLLPGFIDAHVHLSSESRRVITRIFPGDHALPG